MNGEGGDMDAIEAFLQVLDPNDNSTGGGAASALAGAMAAALAAMVARLSVGKFPDASEAAYRQVSATGETLAAKLSAGAAADAEAFAEVKAAYRLPRETSEQKAERAQAIQAAMINAARVPLDNAGLCVRVLELVGLLEGRSNPDALSDLQCSGHLAQAGLEGCLANVAINLPAIKDPAVVSGINQQVQTLRALARGCGSAEAA
jgi:methenyltetrahydrofolate cyclohydrolase